MLGDRLHRCALAVIELGVGAVRCGRRAGDGLGRRGEPLHSLGHRLLGDGVLGEREQRARSHVIVGRLVHGRVRRAHVRGGGRLRLAELRGARFAVRIFRRPERLEGQH